jgi:glycosyltransferase involved in cell wall biosynthesis
MDIFISDFDLRGSGYLNISTSLCQALSNKGRDVKALGYGYLGQEHPFDFSIIPVPHQGAVSYAATALQNLIKEGVDIESIIVALDIPLQHRYLSIPRNDIPYVAIFPIESGPLTPAWAAPLSSADKLLPISKFGHKECLAAGLEADYIEIGVDVESWRPPSPEERAKLRGALGVSDSDFFVLTVADNHERKNLAAAFQILSKVKKEIPTLWSLVSRVEFRGGWKLHDLANKYEMADIFMPYEKGLSFPRLYSLYAAADAFLLTSKAEGLCMPILEAMATGVPVVATNCTAITEHLEDGRGMLVDPEYQNEGVWGNSIRSFIDTEQAIKQLLRLATMKRDEKQAMIDSALEYVRSRTIESSGDQLVAVLEDLKMKRGSGVKEQVRKAAQIAIL